MLTVKMCPMCKNKADKFSRDVPYCIPGIWSCLHPIDQMIDTGITENDVEIMNDSLADGESIFDENNLDFLDAMIKLKKDNIIEFQKCMSQLKNKSEQKLSDIPHCPTCNSPDIRKISTTAKATNTILFGLLGTKRHKTFHCNNCGYEW